MHRWDASLSGNHSATAIYCLGGAVILRYCVFEAFSELIIWGRIGSNPVFTIVNTPDFEKKSGVFLYFQKFWF